MRQAMVYLDFKVKKKHMNIAEIFIR